MITVYPLSPEDQEHLKQVAKKKESKKRIVKGKQVKPKRKRSSCSTNNFLDDFDYADIL